MDKLIKSNPTFFVTIGFFALLGLGLGIYFEVVHLEYLIHKTNGWTTETFMQWLNFDYASQERFLFNVLAVIGAASIILQLLKLIDAFGKD